MFKASSNPVSVQGFIVKTTHIYRATRCFGNGAAVRAGFAFGRSVAGFSLASSRPMHSSVHCPLQLDPREKSILPGEGSA
ncbi:MAG: hypothetical protein KA914_13075 [Ottowia sp.]|nr:hypothetical protein [Ottowia sp.]